MNSDHEIKEFEGRVHDLFFRFFTRAEEKLGKEGLIRVFRDIVKVDENESQEGNNFFEVYGRIPTIHNLTNLYTQTNYLIHRREKNNFEEVIIIHMMLFSYLLCVENIYLLKVFYSISGAVIGVTIDTNCFDKPYVKAKLDVCHKKISSLFINQKGNKKEYDFDIFPEANKLWLCFKEEVVDIDLRNCIAHGDYFPHPDIRIIDIPGAILRGVAKQGKRSKYGYSFDEIEKLFYKINFFQGCFKSHIDRRLSLGARW